MTVPSGVFVHLLQLIFLSLVINTCDSECDDDFAIGVVVVAFASVLAPEASASSFVTRRHRPRTVHSNLDPNHTSFSRMPRSHRRYSGNPRCWVCVRGSTRVGKCTLGSIGPESIGWRSPLVCTATPITLNLHHHVASSSHTPRSHRRCGHNPRCWMCV